MPGRTPREEREQDPSYLWLGTAKGDRRQERGGPQKGSRARGLALQREEVGEEEPEHRDSPLDFPGPAGSSSLWEKKAEGLGERGLCSPTSSSKQASLPGKEMEPLLLLFHKSRLLTREDQIVAVK